jgi:hypothetical protein
MSTGTDPTMQGFPGLLRKIMNWDRPFNYMILGISLLLLEGGIWASMIPLVLVALLNLSDKSFRRVFCELIAV